MGSRLLVKDNRKGVKGQYLEYCNTKGEFEDLWISNERILSYNTDTTKTKEKMWQCTLDELMYAIKIIMLFL